MRNLIIGILIGAAVMGGVSYAQFDRYDPESNSIIQQQQQDFQQQQLNQTLQGLQPQRALPHPC
jgi:hypothetical protein